MCGELLSHVQSSPHPRGLSLGLLAWVEHGSVVPAPAGVVPELLSPLGDAGRRPRTRGGCPRGTRLAGRPGESSPHPRGLSPPWRSPPPVPSVVPAPAGVVRPRRRRAQPACRRPRTRGGCPSPRCRAVAAMRSSPHPRGLSAVAPGERGQRAVVPAPAGVVPTRRSTSRDTTCRPRTRGGCPRMPSGWRSESGSSPHPRGLSPATVSSTSAAKVVPAPAGVVLDTALPPSRAHSRPRTRGGCPVDGCSIDMPLSSSPHPRVVPHSTPSTRTWTRRPRTRGGCPPVRFMLFHPSASSPHPRGLSGSGGGSTRFRRRPRTRGGCPTSYVSLGFCERSSPHPRGLSSRRTGSVT